MHDVILRVATHRSRRKLHAALIDADLFARAVYSPGHHSAGGYFRIVDSLELRKAVACLAGVSVMPIGENRGWQWRDSGIDNLIPGLGVRHVRG